MQTLSMPSNYSDRFDITKNYRRLFFLQGLGLQAAELNELQDFIRSDLSIMATYLIGQGAVVTGGTVLEINGTSVTMDAAGVNVDGHIVQVPSTVVTILGVGLEYIGVAVINNLITSTQDPTIVEQAPTSPNVGQPGADREQYSGRWCTSTGLNTGESFFPIITLLNGVIIATSTTTTNDFSSALNAYDNSVRGSALLNGMNVSYHSLDGSTGSVIMNVNSGKARVLGVPVTNNYQTQCILSPISDTEAILSDFYTYILPPTAFTVTPSTSGGSLASGAYTYKVTSTISNTESFASSAQAATVGGSVVIGSVALSWTAITGATGYNIYGRTSGDAWKLIASVTTNSYTDTGSVVLTSVTTVAPVNYMTQAHYLPVQSTIELSGYVQATVTVTKGVSYGIDVLPNPSGYTGALSVLSIVSVVQNAYTYSASLDYELSGVYSIQWRNGGTQPTSNSTYTVTYIYNAAYAPSGGITFLDSTQNYFSMSPTYTFVNNTTMSLAYNFYLKRIDRVNIDQFGNFVVFKGTPDYLLANIYPIAKSPNYLSLATVTLQHNVTPISTTDTTTNLRVTDVDYLQSQVLLLQTQVAALALVQDTTNIQSTAVKRGIFVDSLNNINYMDQGQTNTCILFPDTSSIVGTYSISMASVLNLLGVTTNWLTAPYTESAYFSQTLRTGSRQINPYSTIPTTALQPKLILSPAVIHDNRRCWWYSPLVYGIGAGTAGPGGTFGVGVAALPVSDTVSAICTGYQANETINIVLGLNLSVVLHNANSSSAPTVTINPTINTSGAANSSGAATISITIPANTVDGKYIITATGATSGVSATSILTISSTINTINSRVDTPSYEYVSNSRLPLESVGSSDPISETFSYPDPVDFTSIILYVTQLPGDDLYVKVTDTLVGIPDDSIVEGVAVELKSSVVLGNNKLTFSAPITNVPNTEYAIVVLTSTNAGAVATAVLGLKDIPSQVLVNTPPNPSGVLLLSANDNTWTPIQTECLTFTLNRAMYDTTVSHTTTLLTTSAVTSYTDWLVSGDIYVPSGTTCTLYLQDPSGNQYIVTPNQPLFTQPITGVVTLNAVIKSYSSNVSPMIPAGLSLMGGIIDNSGSGTYTTTSIAIPNGTVTPGNLTIVFDSYNPLNNGIAVSVQTAPSTFTAATYVSGTAIGNGWYEVTYSYTGISALSTRLQLVFTTSNTSIRPKVTNIRVIVV